MKKIILILSDCLPLTCGLFFVEVKAAPIFLQLYLAKYFLSILIVFLWSICCNIVPLLLPEISQITYKAALKVLIIISVTLMVGILLVIIKGRVEDIFYQSILVLLGVLALSYRWQKKENSFKFILTSLIYYIGLSMLSFQMNVVSFEWQTLFSCFACGTFFLLVRFSILEDDIVTSKSRELLVAFACSSIALLVFSNDLPSSYLSVLPLIFLSKWAFRTPIKFTRSILPSALFIGIIWLLALYS